jgi:hypothetical protein
LKNQKLKEKPLHVGLIKKLLGAFLFSKPITIKTNSEENIDKKCLHKL